MEFKAILKLVGINPYVTLPRAIRQAIFKEAGKNRGPTPVCGTINGKSYRQTLVKYASRWRLYVNTTMLKNSPDRIGETILIDIKYDPIERTVKPHPAFVKALKETKDIQAVWDGLSPSRQKEILRNISSLKSPDSVSRNIERAIGFLRGKNRFVGRDKP